MKVIPSNLINRDEPVNLANIAWSISEAIGDIIDSAIEQTFDHWELESKRDQSFNDWLNEHDLDTFSELDIDGQKAMEIGLTELIDMLNELSYDEFDQAFEVKLDTDNKPSSGVDYSPDYLPALLSVDVDKVMELWGDRAIDDGRNRSGFIRTCDDGYWTTVQVLSTLIDELPVDTYESFVCRLYETYELEETVNYGRLYDYYYEK